MIIHWPNPWEGKIVYVPVEELAEALYTDSARALKRWSQNGGKLDAYILRDKQLTYYSVGVRYGADGQDYLSPYASDNTKIELLLAKYG